jgi:hypothetical protein
MKISNLKQNITIKDTALQNYNKKMLRLQAVKVENTTYFTENALLFFNCLHIQPLLKCSINQASIYIWYTKWSDITKRYQRLYSPPDQVKQVWLSNRSSKERTQAIWLRIELQYVNIFTHRTSLAVANDLYMFQKQHLHAPPTTRSA